MRFLQTLPAFIAAFAATTMPGTAHPTPSALPQFETMFFGEVEIGTGDTFQGPFGTRVDVPIYSFNLTDTSGNLVATLVDPSADTGIISASGVFFPDVDLVMRWEADQKLAYFSMNGVGDPNTYEMLHVKVETNSDIYKPLNSQFLVANVSSPQGEESTNAFITIFGTS